MRGEGCVDTTCKSCDTVRNSFTVAWVLNQPTSTVSSGDGETETCLGCHLTKRISPVVFSLILCMNAWFVNKRRMFCSCCGLPIVLIYVAWVGDNPAPIDTSYPFIITSGRSPFNDFTNTAIILACYICILSELTFQLFPINSPYRSTENREKMNLLCLDIEEALSANEIMRQMVCVRSMFVFTMRNG